MNNIYTFPSFSQFPNVVHGISTRRWGDMRSFEVIHEDKVHMFFSALSIPLEKVVGMQQKHTSTVARVTNATSALVPVTDGLLTREKGLYLYAVTADCLPVIFFDPQHEIVGVAHAGYKGLSAGILAQMVDELTKITQSPATIRVGIGPGIGVCCYNVQKDRVELFRDYEDHFAIRDGVYFLNIKAIAIQQLTQKGVLKTNIEAIDICTNDTLDTFYSYRGDSKETFGQFATIIGMRLLGRQNR